MKSLKEIIYEASEKKIAIGHFNISNLEQLKAIAGAGKKLNLSVIIGVSEGEREFLGIHHVKDFIKSYNDEHKQENGFFLFLNADHTYSLEKVKEAAKANFDSIVFDGGKFEFKENVKQTIEAVKIVKDINPEILVEGELGYIGQSSKILKEMPKGVIFKKEDLPTVEQALEFVEKTGVDLFAPAVGNVHGQFANMPNPKLDIEKIREIKKALENLPAGRRAPLVLHGGSGISDADFVQAIDTGISVIHISTELRLAWRKGMEESLKENPEEIAPYKIEPEVIKEIEKIVENRLKLFNKI